MSVGAIATGILVLAIASGIYIIVGEIYHKYYDMNNDMITNDDYYSQDRQSAMSNQFSVWYALPMVLILAFIIYSILEAIKNKDNVV